MRRVTLRRLTEGGARRRGDLRSPSSRPRPGRDPLIAPFPPFAVLRTAFFETFWPAQTLFCQREWPESSC